MKRKPKFKPVITRVKLNPEQAVLTCDCYNVFAQGGGGVTYYVDQPAATYSACSVGGFFGKSVGDVWLCGSAEYGNTGSTFVANAINS